MTNQMTNLYKFNCVVWVRGETLEAAEKHLHEEVQYHFGHDNDLISLQNDKGELVETDYR